ncbi:MAG: hypothetical protein PWP16_1331 [Eubacteriaceae bacterium]|jgi:hypothetical protein|nr:hypothetical protein [Eubacteriaceae bacterium]
MIELVIMAFATASYIAIVGVFLYIFCGLLCLVTVGIGKIKTLYRMKYGYSKRKGKGK